MEPLFSFWDDLHGAPKFAKQKSVINPQNNGMGLSNTRFRHSEQQAGKTHSVSHVQIIRMIPTIDLLYKEGEKNRSAGDC